MDLIEDPLESNETLKSATIYRNGALNYIYVCYHCESSFINITDTLNHVESHFDVKVNIVTDNLDLKENVSEIVSKPELFDTKKRSETLGVTKLPQSINQIITETNDNTPFVNIAEFESEIFEHKYESQKNVEEDSKIDLNEHHHHNQCSICRHQCKTTSSLIIHLIKVHVNMTTLTCPECSENLKTGAEFKIHLQQHIKNNQTTYDILIDKLIAKCELNIKVEIRNDKLRKNKKKCLTCDICSLNFNTKKCLIIHMKKEHIVAQPVKNFLYDCDKCDRQFDTKFLFYAHQYGHLTIADQVNVLDDEVLRQNLRKFLDTNIDRDESTQNVTYYCKLCQHMCVKRRASIELHVLQEHIYHIKNTKNTVKRFPCEYCGVKFAVLHNLVVHIRKHTQEKPYTCTICHKSFALSSYMKYHERVHSGIRPHQCPICGLSFKSNSKLNFHMKGHSDDTTKCPICSKEVKPHRLKIHIRNVHQNTHRPYKCTVCLQGFKTAKTLKTHSFRHSGEKNYECRFHCNERFVSAAGRRAHERTKHEAL